MAMARFGRDASQDAILASLHRDGVVVLDHLIAGDVVDRLIDDVQPELDRTPAAGGEFFGGAMKRVHGLAAKSSAAGDIIADPMLGALADAVLLDNCKAYQVQVLGILQVWQGGQLQPLHRDTGVYQPYVELEPGDKEILLSFIVAGTDFTAENGATRMVPGSHTWPRDRTATEDEVVLAEMAKGSVVVWLGSLLHGAGINQTDTPRSAIVSGFSVGWLRQEENQYLSCPPDKAADLPPRVQQLLGYRAHTPVLGWSEDRDPELLLGPRKANHEAEGYDAQDLQNV